jgi:hypothetical protein
MNDAEALLLGALLARFRNEGLQVGSPPGPLAVFPAKHPQVGDLTLSRPHIGGRISVDITIGDTLRDALDNIDTHLPLVRRAERLTRDVARFLQELFADRLLFWRSVDGTSAGWRERGEAGHAEPLVLDDRPYNLYVWSRPLGTWRASTAILARGRIRDERDYQIALMVLETEDIDQATREQLQQLVVKYTNG